MFIIIFTDSMFATDAKSTLFWLENLAHGAILPNVDAATGATMAWPTDHKEQTHRKIVEAAAAAFRQHGVADVGIADVMRKAGLTHGGFYAHFPSKRELVAEVTDLMAERRAATAKAVAGRAPEERLAAIADHYLTSQHREHPESGCMIAAIGCELARADGAASEGFAANIAAWLCLLADCAPAADPDVRRSQAVGAYAAMIGGMILARGVDDSHAADRILADVRAFLRSALADQVAP
jgi:TetR/AcrR family transcriptional repressor of nem operon